MPRKKPIQTIRHVMMTEIVGLPDDIRRVRATIQAILDQSPCKVRGADLSDPVPHAS